MADADFAANIGWHCIHFRGSSKYFTLSQRGWRQRQHKEAFVGQDRMKSRQHYILTISRSDNSTSSELVAQLHMTVFHPSQNNFFFFFGGGGGGGGAEPFLQ